MQNIYLENLPTKNLNGKSIIDWNKSINYEVNFIYDDIIGILKIMSYNNKTYKLTVKYQDKIHTTSKYYIENCKIASLINKKTTEYKYHVGELFKDNHRDIIITKCEKREKVRLRNNIIHEYPKWYQYTCNKCGWTEGWIQEESLSSGSGCACCDGKVVVEGINDIPTTASWMIHYFRGGYDEAKLYTKSSNKSIYPICPDCGKTKEKPMSVNNIYTKHSIGCICSDGFSYPEKFINELINQLNIIYIHQYSKKEALWCKNYKYDFYIPIYNYIIEVHGEGHYNGSFERSKRGRSLIQEQINDALKKQLAKENGIKHYITIDCCKSELEWIKKSVMESELPTLFNFTENDIDWIKCHEYALSNLVKMVCEFKRMFPDTTTTKLMDIFKLSNPTVVRYLKKGTICGWCNYDAKHAIRCNSIKKGEYE